MHNKPLRRSAFLILISLACNVSTFSPTTPVPIPTVVTSIQIPYAKIDYYDVSGSTGREIRDQLNALSSVDQNGVRGDAVTSWEIHWMWDGYGSETCDLSSATATYDIRVRFPRWKPAQDASAELTAKWNAYILALAEHERVHVDNVVANLPYVIKAIRGAACDTADARAQAVLASIREYDVSYDERTDHGATQGAIFP
jgi:predicted secreted Zn-dependent protease